MVLTDGEVTRDQTMTIPCVQVGSLCRSSSTDPDWRFFDPSEGLRYETQMSTVQIPRLSWQGDKEQIERSES